MVWGAGKVDYVDSAGVQHYCVAIADLPNSNTITDSRPVENIAGYVYRSIRNRIADYERSRAKSASLDGMLDEEGELPFLQTLAAENEEPFAAEDRAERIHRLTDAIGRLEPRQRAVLIATELRGKSFRELSEEWGEPIGTLLSRKSRAVKALRNLLEQDEL